MRNTEDALRNERLAKLGASARRRARGMAGRTSGAQSPGKSATSFAIAASRIA
jgi:hypothetical protein